MTKIEVKTAEEIAAEAAEEAVEAEVSEENEETRAAEPADAEEAPVDDDADDDDGADDDTDDADDDIDDDDDDGKDDDEDDDTGDGAAQGEGGPNIFEAITAEVMELRDRYARLQAEWDNYRKRTAAERESERVRAAEKLVTDLLPALDDIERALNHAKESGDGSGLVEGVEAIQTKFLQILEKHKVTVVPAMGEPFDAMKHQAVGTAEDESVPEETVVQVYQQGYQMGDRVIRPSMVVTSTGGPAREAQADE